MWSLRGYFKATDHVTGWTIEYTPAIAWDIYVVRNTRLLIRSIFCPVSLFVHSWNNIVNANGFGYDNAVLIGLSDDPLTMKLGCEKFKVHTSTNKRPSRVDAGSWVIGVSVHWETLSSPLKRNWWQANRDSWKRWNWSSKSWVWYISVGGFQNYSTIQKLFCTCLPASIIYINLVQHKSFHLSFFSR